MRTITKPIVIIIVGVLLLFVGIWPAAADETIQFEAGLNFWAYPVQTESGYSAYDLIQDLNGVAPVSGLQRYNLQTGEFESCVMLNGFAAGVDFPVAEVDGYIVTVGATPFEYVFAGTRSCPEVGRQIGRRPGGCTRDGRHCCI